jgi:hypothetical protein
MRNLPRVAEKLRVSETDDLPMARTTTATAPGTIPARYASPRESVVAASVKSRRYTRAPTIGSLDVASSAKMVSPRAEVSGRTLIGGASTGRTGWPHAFVAGCAQAVRLTTATRSIMTCTRESMICFPFGLTRDYAATARTHSEPGAGDLSPAPGLILHPSLRVSTSHPSRRPEARQPARTSLPSAPPPRTRW